MQASGMESAPVWWSWNVCHGTRIGSTTGQGDQARSVAATNAASGQEMYTNYCAVCHGTDGKGGGPASALKAPADPTTLTGKQWQIPGPSRFQCPARRRGTVRPWQQRQAGLGSSFVI
jgi:hypothetical protein